MQHTGKILIIVGILLIVVGTLFYLGANKLGWVGRLPGDIRIERESFKFYFPVTTMILASILLTLFIRIIQKFYH